MRRRSRSDYSRVRTVREVRYVQGAPRVVYRDVYVPQNTTPGRSPTPPAKRSARKQPVRTRSVSPGRSLLYRPRQPSRFGRRYVRFLFDKASGGSGRRYMRRCR